MSVAADSLIQDVRVTFKVRKMGALTRKSKEYNEQQQQQQRSRQLNWHA